MVARVVTTGCLALALAGCGDAPSDTGAAGGAGGVGETSSATSGPGPVAVSATTGAGAGPSTGTGGGNPDDPYGCLLGAAPSRPTSIPEGYRPWACWSQKPQCLLWIPEDPATMVDRLEWGPCAPGSPGGGGVPPAGAAVVDRRVRDRGHVSCRARARQQWRHAAPPSGPRVARRRQPR